jgi:uncharacterized protein
LKNPDFESARTYALNRLERELAPWLAYHSLAHTRDTVVPATSKLGLIEGLSPYQLELVTTGAAFHDLGFVIQYSGHEAAGARIAREILPALDFNETEIQTIEGIIMATQLPQNPHTLLERIVTDADLATLGLDHFIERNADLRSEQAFIGRFYTDVEWFTTQIRFIQRHCYFTLAARSWLDARKAENIASLEALLAQVKLPAPETEKNMRIHEDQG